jgi:hypothetical protein
VHDYDLPAEQRFVANISQITLGKLEIRRASSVNAGLNRELAENNLLKHLHCAHIVLYSQSAYIAHVSAPKPSEHLIQSHGRFSRKRRRAEHGLDVRCRRIVPDQQTSSKAASDTNALSAQSCYPSRDRISWALGIKAVSLRSLKSTAHVHGMRPR